MKETEILGLKKDINPTNRKIDDNGSYSRNSKKSGNQVNLDDLISLNEAARKSGFTPRHLRHLAATGKLWAKKFGRNWLTSNQAINEYLNCVRKPGPKPK